MSCTYYLKDRKITKEHIEKLEELEKDFNTKLEKSSKFKECFKSSLVNLQSSSFLKIIHSFIKSCILSLLNSIKIPPKI